MKNTGLLRPLVLALLLALSALLLSLPCSSALAEVVYCDWNENKNGAVFYVYLESEDENGQLQSVQTIVATGDVSLNNSKRVEATCLEDGKFVYDVSNIMVINELPNLDYSGTNELEMLEMKKGHSLTSVSAQNATCTNYGNIDYYHCGECGYNFLNYEIYNTSVAQDEDILVAPLMHQYGDPSWNWTGYTAATATFTCTREGCTEAEAGHSLTLEAEVEDNGASASCQGPVQKVYTASVTFNEHTYTNDKTETLVQLPHAYGAPDSWSWESDYSAATAVFICPNCTEAAEGHRVEAPATQIEDDGAKAKCGETVTKTYTATVTFNSQNYSDQTTETLQPLSHLYGAPDSWAWTGYTAAEATFTCTRENCTEAVDGHTLTVPAAKIEDDGAKAKCGEAVIKTYTATVEIDGQSYTDDATETLQPLEHLYGEPVWSWTGYTAAEATFTCTRENCTEAVEGHSVTVDAAKIENDGAQPAYMWTVTRTYTATVEFNGQTYQGQKKETLPPIEDAHEHDYDPEPSVTVTFVVVNGAWDDGGTEPVTVVLPAARQVLKGSDIPAVGNKPDAHYKAGRWDAEPVAWVILTQDTVYTYTYAEKAKQTVTVTFRVFNGLWDEGGSEDKSVSFFHYEGEEPPVLSKEDIPAVGNRPYSGYAAGGWSTVPREGMQITEAMTFSYSYKAPASALVTPAPPPAKAEKQNTKDGDTAGGTPVNRLLRKISLPQAWGSAPSFNNPTTGFQVQRLAQITADVQNTIENEDELKKGLPRPDYSTKDDSYDEGSRYMNARKASFENNHYNDNIQRNLHSVHTSKKILMIMSDGSFDIVVIPGLSSESILASPEYHDYNTIPENKSFPDAQVDLEITDDKHTLEPPDTTHTPDTSNRSNKPLNILRFTDDTAIQPIQPVFKDNNTQIHVQ